MVDYKDILKEQERQFEWLVKKDKTAKEEGELVNRYISECVADGYAYYIITRIAGSRVHVKHFPIHDGYRIQMVEDMDCILPIKYVKANLKRRDAMAEIFGGNK